MASRDYLAGDKNAMVAIRIRSQSAYREDAPSKIDKDKKGSG